MQKSKSLITKLCLACIAAALFSVVACKDEEDDQHHSNHVTITFTAPAEWATFNNGDTVRIEGIAIGEATMHGYELYILNKTASDTVFTVEEHAHGDTIPIQHEWVVDVTDTSTMELGIIVTIDHDNNTQTKKVDFNCLP